MILSFQQLTASFKVECNVQLHLQLSLQLPLQWLAATFAAIFAATCEAAHSGFLVRIGLTATCTP